MPEDVCYLFEGRPPVMQSCGKSVSQQVGPSTIPPHVMHGPAHRASYPANRDGLQINCADPSRRLSNTAYAANGAHWSKKLKDGRRYRMMKRNGVPSAIHRIDLCIHCHILFCSSWLW